MYQIVPVSADLTSDCPQTAAGNRRMDRALRSKSNRGESAGVYYVPDRAGVRRLDQKLAVSRRREPADGSCVEVEVKPR